MTGATGGSSGYPSQWNFMLAVGATAPAICMSVLTDSQRSGEMPERLVRVPGRTRIPPQRA